MIRRMGHTTHMPISGPGKLARTVLGTLAVVFLLAAVGCERRDESQPSSASREGSPQRTRHWQSVEDPSTSLSADAKVEVHEMLRLDLQRVRHPSDGGGRAWLEAPTPSEPGGKPVVVAGSRARFEVVYEAGPHGIAENGLLFLQTSPFWGWDSPQSVDPDGPGYTDVTSEAPGIELDVFPADRHLLAIRIGGRALLEGERVRIVFGAGSALARVDDFAEHTERLWVAVDGDGDGVRGLVLDSPSIDLIAGQPAQLRLTLPTTARPGERVRLVVAALDRSGNAGVRVDGDLQFESVPDGLELPERIQFGPEDNGRKEILVDVSVEGVYRLRAQGTGEFEGLDAESNPLIVRVGIPQLLWGDLHGHSQLSDGTGTPEDYYRYARDIAALDVAALTDHDHWGMRFLDAAPDVWEAIRTAATRFYEPRRFVTLLGYEWTSWLYGHRHVIYFADDGPLLSSIDPEFETPAQLWAGLRGKPALTFAHHSAGEPVSTDWAYAPDPILEPVTEIVSVHGSSEALDSPGVIYNPVPGNFVRDTLDFGYRFGFIGSGDSHDGHPGLAQLSSPRRQGGLAGIFAEARTREAVLAALRARSVFASGGPRSWLWFTLDGEPMGATLPSDSVQVGMQELRCEVIAEGSLAHVDLIRSGGSVERISVQGEREWSMTREIPRLAPGEYLYLRAVQEDGGTVWSSPIYASK